MNHPEFRAPAVPLVTHDPMFSVWSFADKLTDDVPRHWSGARQYMFGIVTVDGTIYEFLGKVAAIDERYVSRYRILPQVSCDIRPMTTEYCFENEILQLRLRFTSPLLLDEPDILARPLSYVDYDVTLKGGKAHDVHVQFGFSGEFCVDTPEQTVTIGYTPYSICFSGMPERMLQSCGDDNRISWGSFHVIAPEYVMEAMSLRRFWVELRLRYSSKEVPRNPLPCQGPDYETAGKAAYAAGEAIKVLAEHPTILVRREFANAQGTVHGELALAYDDLYAVQVLGENLPAYWKRDGLTFDGMVVRALREKAAVLEKVHVFEEKLLDAARAVSPKYADLLSLAYRQSVAGHKLVDRHGELLFISKENYSNGCACTVDITYPAMPLYLLYAPQLVRGMLEPIFNMVDEGCWLFEFAPHDAGRYPLLNGQAYGYLPRARSRRPNPRDSQMPVEECGNMLLCVAAVCWREHSTEYFTRHRALLDQWANYLLNCGYDPENQLCTDDFAGHLAHNCNLSVKLICALCAYARLLRACGETENAEKYDAAAHEFAAKWEAAAFDGDHYRLAFDAPGSWSLKYNMVWDRLLGLGLFPQRVYDAELAWYKTHFNRYGIPLDSRCECSKMDWQFWSAALFDDDAYTRQVTDAVWDWVSQTPDRMPFPDLIFTTVPWLRAFVARPVIGGIFINLLTPELFSLDEGGAG